MVHKKISKVEIFIAIVVSTGVFMLYSLEWPLSPGRDAKTYLSKDCLEPSESLLIPYSNVWGWQAHPINEFNIIGSTTIRKGKF